VENFSAPFSFIDDVDSTPAAYNEKIYFGCSNNNIYCVDALTLQVSSVKSLGSSVISSPAIRSASGLVFVSSLNGKMYALDANNLANEKWSYDIPTVENKQGLTIKFKSSPAIINSMMFIVAGDSSNRHLYCFGD
jgi:outer membrane protein assembly factor BamB